MLLVAAYFANQETGVQDQAGHDGTEKNYAQNNFNVLLPVENDPPKTHGNRSERQTDREGQEENDLAASGHAHTAILAQQDVRWTQVGWSTAPKKRKDDSIVLCELCG